MRDGAVLFLALTGRISQHKFAWVCSRKEDEYDSEDFYPK